MLQTGNKDPALVSAKFNQSTDSTGYTITFICLDYTTSQNLLCLDPFSPSFCAQAERKHLAPGGFEPQPTALQTSASSITSWPLGHDLVSLYAPLSECIWSWWWWEVRSLPGRCPLRRPSTRFRPTRGAAGW